MVSNERGGMLTTSFKSMSPVALENWSLNYVKATTQSRHNTITNSYDKMPGCYVVTLVEEKAKLRYLLLPVHATQEMGDEEIAVVVGNTTNVATNIAIAVAVTLHLTGNVIVVIAASELTKIPKIQRISLGCHYGRNASYLPSPRSMVDLDHRGYPGHDTP